MYHTIHSQRNKLHCKYSRKYFLIMFPFVQYQNEVITFNNYEECTDLVKVEKHLKFWNDLLSKNFIMLVSSYWILLLLASTTESAVIKTGCQVPCTYFIYRKSKGIINPVRSKTSGVQIGFSSMTLQIKEDTLLYPSSSLFGDIGGSLGLFLGFSLLSFGDTVLDICKKILKHFANQSIYFSWWMK